MAKRRYTDEFRANAVAAVAANGGDVLKTANALGIPETTLRYWVTGQFHPEAAKNGELKKADLADCLEEVAYKIVDAMPKKIKDAPLEKLAVTLGITVEKMRLLREQATALTGNTNLSDDERLARLERLFERANARRTARGGPTPAGPGSPNLGAAARTADVGVP